MTRIGAGWLKQDKNGDHYISVKLEENLLPLVITPEKRITIKPNKDKTKENQPDYYIDSFIPKPQEKETANGDDEFPL